MVGLLQLLIVLVALSGVVVFAFCASLLAFLLWRTFLRGPVSSNYLNAGAAAAAAGAVALTSRDVLVVLGSGGHTMEALEMIKTVVASNARPFRVAFVVADGDVASTKRVEAMHAEGKLAFPFRFESVPRARVVGQSWLTTPLTTLKALPVAADILLRVRPALIFCNGPGTCIPFCVVASVMNLVGVFRPAAKIVYIESLARVQQLSLSGEIVYRYGLGTVFVQWPQLQQKYPFASYRGILI